MPTPKVAPVEPSSKAAAGTILTGEIPVKTVSVSERLPRWTAGGALFTVWGIGFFVAVLPTVLGLIANEWRRRDARRIEADDWTALLETLRRTLAIGRGVELRETSESAIPMTWGVMRPVVMLPEGARDWPAAKRQLVLLHELVHVQRFDFGFQVAGRIAASMYWFHPLAWYALGRLRIECEQACDDLVIHSGERPVAYAEQLLDLARSLRCPRFSMAVAMARTNALEERMTAMFDGTRSHRPLDPRSARRLAAVATALVFGLATIQARPQTAAADSPPVQEKPASEPVVKGTGRISGRVVRDAESTAATGATVVLLLPPPKGQNVYYGRLPLRSVTAGPNGEFSFEGLIPGRHRVWANLGTLTSRRERSRGQVIVLPESGEGVKPVELRLITGVAVTTRVKDKATGKPIPDATVELGWTDFPTDATTDRDGRVVLQPLTAERWLVSARADGYAKDEVWLNLENGKNAEAEFLLGPGGTIEGVVRDGEKRPLAGVGLSASVAGMSRQTSYVETDKDGRYRLGHLPRDVDLQLSVSKKEYDSKTVPARVSAALVPMDLILKVRPHGGSITGVVLDPKEQPIAGAEIINMGTSSSDVRETKTGPDGRFLLDNLYEDLNLGKEVLVRAKGFASKRVKVETGPADKPAEVSIALETGHRIKGRVVDDNGRPLNDVNVYFAQGADPFSEGGRGKTDAEGRFAFDSLPADCPFTFNKAGYSELEVKDLPLDTDEVVPVTMAPAGVVVGRVIDAKTGKPVRAFNVKITFSPKRQPDEPSNWLLSDLIDPGQTCNSIEGDFKLGNLVVDMPLQVMVSAEGYERGVNERVMVVRPGNKAVTEFRLEPLDPARHRVYAGRLLGGNGIPIAGAQLRLIAGEPRDPNRQFDFPFNWQMIQSGQVAQQESVTRFLTATTDKEGRFRFTMIPRESEVELAWWGRGIAPGRAGHLEQTAENATEKIEITTPEPARISGTVDRKLYPGAVRIQMNRKETDLGSMDIQLSPDRSEFTSGDLAPGEYQVSVMSPYERVPGIHGGMTTRPLASENVVVDPGEFRRVEFKK